MGNCSHKGVVNISDPIRVMTDSGGVREFEGPVQVLEVVNDHPGYGIFRKGRLLSPLLHHEQLLNGQLYYLLPLKKVNVVKVTSELKAGSPKQMSPRVSSDLTINLPMESAQVLPSATNGVWRVKLVIDTKQLEEIFSEQVNIEVLIEKMRMVASTNDATPRRMKIPLGLGVHWRPTVSRIIKVLPKISKQ